MHNRYASVREEAKERQREHGGTAPGRKKETLPEQTREVKDRHERETNAIRAKAAGTNENYLRTMERVRETHPEKFEEVRTGKKTVTQAKREIRQEEARAKIKDLPDGKYRACMGLGVEPQTVEFEGLKELR